MIPALTAPARRLRPTSLAFALAAALTLPAAAQDAEPSITVDGRLDEAAWAEAQRFADFVLVEPWTGAAPDPALATEALLLATPAEIGRASCRERV